jgi:hypothetical protein
VAEADDGLRGGDEVSASHTKVHRLFVSNELPGDGQMLFAVVDWLAQRSRRIKDVEQYLDHFDDLWRVAVRASTIEAGSPAPDVPDGGGAESTPRVELPAELVENIDSAPNSPDAEVQAISQDDSPRRVVVPDLSLSRAGELLNLRQRSPALPDLTTSHAVVVGVSDYTELPWLSGTDESARGLATALGSTDIGPAFDKHAIDLHVNPSSRLQVEPAVEDALSSTSDAFLLYFSGHGVISPSGELLLALGDAPADAAYDHGSLPYAQLRDRLASASAERIVIVLDCCFAGRAVEVMAGQYGGALTHDRSGTYVLAATGTTAAFAMAGSGGSYTLFTGGLLDILHSGIDGGPEMLTMDALYGELRRRAVVDRTPLPTMVSTARAEIAFAYNSAYVPDDVRRERLRSFVTDLRALLDHVGPISYRQLAARTGESKSTLARFFQASGRPEWATADRLLRLVDGVDDEQIAEWQERWSRLGRRSSD